MSYLKHRKTDTVSGLSSYLHAKYAVMAMRAGRNVFVEKPLCLSKEEADELLKVQEETGVLAQVGQLVRFWDEYAWLKKIKDSGIYGKVITAEGCWNYPADYRFSMYYNVKFEKATVVYDSGTNEFVVYLAEGGKFTPEIEDRFVGSAGSGNISSLGGYYNELLYFVNLQENPEMEQIASMKEGARSVELALEGIAKSRMR